MARWAAWELAANFVFEPAILIEERWLARFPDHRDAPLVAWENARVTEQRALSYRAGTPDAAEAMRVARTSQARLSRYVGSTPWTEANRGDPEALRRAAEVVKRPLAPR